MSVRRLTLSVPKRIEKAAGATPVSAWVTQLIEEHLDDLELERRWREFYRDVAPSREDARRAAPRLSSNDSLTRTASARRMSERPGDILDAGGLIQLERRDRTMVSSRSCSLTRVPRSSCR
jgi:hypothetical protein